jgi:hypothetical protein
MNAVKTGEVFDVDEEGNLYLCESFEYPDTKEVFSTRTLVPKEPE